MKNKILNQFQDIISFYEKVIGELEELYNAMVDKEHEKIEALNKKTMMMDFELKQKIEAMEKEVKNECEKRGITDKKLINLFPYYETKEVEKMMACRETAFHFEKKLNDITKKIKSKAIAHMETSQIMIDVSVHIAKEEHKGSNLFLNQEF